ncbi:hypothetical protein [Lysobacter gummosus]|uniref:hypothetical protein n=1 Tax=Lysobacter gummosus TaxID=262324 RepID=UPI0036259E8D
MRSSSSNASEFRRTRSPVCIMQRACANARMRIRDHGGRPLRYVANADSRSHSGRTRAAANSTNRRRQKAPISGGF